MSEKKLESNSIYNQFDADGDGIVTDAEMAQADRLMEMNQKRLEIENQDKREDAQRAMSWFALFGMLLYPASVVVADLLMLDKAPGIGPVIDLLKVLLKARCEANDVALKLVATVDNLERIAGDDEAEVPALSGWRRDLFGADAIKLKHGRLALALSADSKTVEVVERP